jgi:xanthine dehydrogenase accessory factor
MLVRGDGSIVGTIGGGPLEGSFIERAREALQTERSFTQKFESAALGMACGGGGTVLIEPVTPARTAMRELFLELTRLLDQGRRGWLVTAVVDEDDGGLSVHRCLVDGDGSVTGDAVCEPETLQGLAKRGGTYDRIVGGDPARTHVQTIGANGSAYVFGAGHCGEKLVPVLSNLGFFTVVVDDRPEFASEERFPAADRIVVPSSFDGAVGTLPIDEDSYLVIVTRGHAHDKSVLAQALRTKASYVGMIGSKKKVAETFRALGEEGFSLDDLARVHAPIGLSIGAETPEEIAVSIAAELIQVRAARAG